MLRYADEKSGGKLTSTEKKEFYRELFSLAIPIGLQNLLIALIGATDALMLGRLSQDAVAAVSLANQIVFVMKLFTIEPERNPTPGTLVLRLPPCQCWRFLRFTLT